jgi:hypothetical protein
MNYTNHFNIHVFIAIIYRLLFFVIFLVQLHYCSTIWACHWSHISCDNWTMWEKYFKKAYFRFGHWYLYANFLLWYAGSSHILQRYFCVHFALVRSKTICSHVSHLLYTFKTCMMMRNIILKSLLFVYSMGYLCLFHLYQFVFNMDEYKIDITTYTNLN